MYGCEKHNNRYLKNGATNGRVFLGVKSEFVGRLLWVWVLLFGAKLPVPIEWIISLFSP